jgi:ketosteroid isomerase-like protein
MPQMSPDENAIRDLDVAWGQAACKHDLDAVMSFYAQDGSLAWTGEPAAHGHKAIRASWTEMMKIPGLSLEFVPERIVVSESGDLASDFGVVKLGMTGKPTVSAKYLVVWRKEADKWKVLYDSYSYNNATDGS